MKLNPSLVLRHIKRKLGTAYHKLEIDDDQIMDIVWEESLYTYSSYFPYITQIKLGEDDTVNDPELNGVYEIDTDLEILGVNKVFNHQYERSRAQRYTLNPAMEAAANDMFSSYENKDTFRFMPPNRLEIFPKNVFIPEMMAEIKAVHPIHLMTIHPGMRNHFLKLAELDVKVDIYQMRTQYESINTSFGEINLDLDKYSNAESEREDLIQEFEENYIKNSRRKSVWIE